MSTSPLLLNRQQRSSLEASLRHLEETLHRALGWLREPPPDLVLTHYKPVPESLRQPLEALFDEMLAEVTTLASELALRPRAEDLQRDIDAEMAVEWAALYEALSTQLKRYGQVDPALTEALDPHIERLILLTHQAGSLAASQGEPPAAASNVDGPETRA